MNDGATLGTILNRWMHNNSGCVKSGHWTENDARVLPGTIKGVSEATEQEHLGTHEVPPYVGYWHPLQQ